MRAEEFGSESLICSQVTDIVAMVIYAQTSASHRTTNVIALKTAIQTLMSKSA
jgi:hypothetical protein